MIFNTTPINLISNGSIALSYLWIGGGLLAALPTIHRPSVRLFIGTTSAFVLSCGIGHGLEAAFGMPPGVSLWHLVTAGISGLSAVLITKASPALKKAAIADRLNERLLEEWSDPIGLYQVEGNDFRILFQNQAAIKNLGINPVGQLLCETFPNHREPGGALFGGALEDTLISVYLDVARTGKPWQGDLCYQGDNVDGWYRTRVQRVSEDIVIITWRDVSAEKISIETQVIFNKVQKALIAREFVLHYQPIIFLESNDIAGYEALVRWPREDGSFRAPNEFLYAIENTELVNTLCWQVSEMACDELNRWADENVNQGCYLAINIAPFTISSPDFESRFYSVLDMHRAPRHRVVIEITEEVALEMPIVPRVERMRSAGLHVAIDDFGTGQTSFANLHNYPADIIKIDRIFISDLIENQASQELVQTVVRLASVLKMRVVAEGVEDKETSDWLRAAGVQYGQGYYWSKPGPLE